MEQDEDYGTRAERKLDDGRTLFVIPLTYGRARLCVGNAHNPLIFDNGY